MAHDVFQYHDGIVHHQAYRQRQAQQRDVVQTVGETPKQGYGTNQRHRQRQGRNDGGDETAQKQKDHQHHQRNGAQQGERDIMQRFAHGDRAVVDRRHLDRLRHLTQQLGQGRAHRIHHPYRVGAGLALNRHGD